MRGAWWPVGAHGTRNMKHTYCTARHSRNQTSCERGGYRLLRLHKKSSRNEKISTDTDRLKICATSPYFPLGVLSLKRATEMKLVGALSSGMKHPSEFTRN